MPDTATTIHYFAIVIPNKTGEGAKALSALKDAGVNMVGFWGYPIKGKQAQLDIAPSDVKAFPKIAKKLGYAVGPKMTAFLLNGEDRPGVLADAMQKLSAAGIGTHAAQAICAGEGRFGALVQVLPDDVKKAKKVLGA